MPIDFTRRRRGARWLAAVGLVALVLSTRQWGCSDDETPGAGTAGRTGQPAAGAVPTAIDGTADAGPAGLPLVDLEPGREYLLLLGFDGPLSPPGRTDAILIVALDFDERAVGVISVPRDLWVDIPGFDQPGRINKIYRIGENLRGRGKGLLLLKVAIARELGIPVRHTVAVDMRGFAEIVDLLGGIDVDVACPILDNFISSSSETGYETLSLEAGRQRLDGATALLYSRSRHGRSDLDRASRQQAVLTGLWRRAARLDTLGRLPALWEKISRRVRTDLDLNSVIRYAALARVAGADRIHGLVLSEPTVYQWRSPDGQSVLRLDRARARADVKRLFDAPRPGKKLQPLCRPADAALHWRDRKGRAGAGDGEEAEPPDAGP